MALSRCHSSHSVRHWVFFLIAGQIISMITRLARSRSHCWGEEIVAQYAFRFNDGQWCTFGAVFILHIIQKCLLIFHCIGSLVFKNDIHSLVPNSIQSQRPERINDMCYNDKHTSCWSNCHIIYGQLVSRQHHGEVYVCLAWCLLPTLSSHNTTHKIEHFIRNNVDVMESNYMPFQHPLGPVPEWSWNFHDALDDGLCILCGEAWPVISVFWILEPLAGEFCKLGGTLKQRQFRIPPCLHIN